MKPHGNRTQLRLLLVGALPDIKRPNSLGGIATLFHHLVVALAQHPEVEMKVIDLERIQRPGLKRWFSSFKVLFEIVRHTPRCDVLSIHTGSTSLHLSGPTLAVIAWLLRKPFIIRQSAGAHYRELSPWKGPLVRWAARKARLYLVETRRLVELARSDGLQHARWFPNNRPLISTSVQGREAGRRFVFISRVSRTKGIFEILEAGRHLPEGATVDVYGPFDGDLGPQIFAGQNSVRYQGLLPPDKVMKRLADYDVLLLPTYYCREGYPGIIIEAFAAGLPAICTRWMSLDELVDERCGILVNPRDASSLLEAMRRITSNPELFQRLRQGARERAHEFSSAVWTEHFLGYCREIVMEKLTSSASKAHPAVSIPRA